MNENLKKGIGFLFFVVLGLGVVFAALSDSQPSRRRAALYDKLDGGVALLLAESDFSTTWQAHRYDPSYKPQEFKQEVHFHYLTGLGVKSAVLLVDGKKRKTTLYLRDEVKEKDFVSESSGLDRVAPMTSLLGDLDALTERRPAIYLLLGRKPGEIPFGSEKIFPEGLKEPTDRQQDLKTSLSRRFGWMEFRNLDPLISELRAVKDAEEIELIRRAVEISSLGLIETLRSVRPGIRERELSGVSRFVYRKEGAQRIAYSEDLQSGPNFVKSFIEIFNQYNKLDRIMEEGEVMLVDLSCEYNYYRTDIARTAPVSGKFTAQQRALYDLYLVAYRAALAAIRPGVTQRDITMASVEAMKAQVPNLKEDYLRRGADDYIARHGSGNPLGHYVDYYVSGAGDRSKPLVPGQIFTIEPKMILPDLNNFRVTLEDMILVTPFGYELLSKILPMEAEDIERIIAEPGLLDLPAKVRKR